VLDRQSLTTRVQEEEINRLVSDENERQKIKSAGVLIRGKMLRHAFGQQVEQAEQTGVRNGVQYKIPVYRAVGEGTVEVAFDVVELGTTETIASKSIPVTKKGNTDWFPSPPSISQEPIFNDCYSMVVDRFMKAISAHDEMFKDRLYKLAKSPDNDAGIGMFQAQDYARATKHFEAALESAKALPKITPDKLSQVWHNIGLAYECANKYAKAVECYKQALSLRPGSTTQQSLTRCQQRIQNEEKLKAQGVRTS
jgi:tetratricopeptide (TPR) repeat protein